MGSKVLLQIADPMTDVWQPGGDLSAKSPQDWEGATLTAENFEKDLTPRSVSQKFKIVLQTLVVVFGMLGSYRLQKIH